MDIDEEQTSVYLNGQNDKIIHETPEKIIGEKIGSQIEDFDKYASHKSVSQNLLNTSIIQSHIGTLVYILSNDTDNEGFELSAILLISLSLVLQFLIFFMLTWLFYRRQDYTSPSVSAVGVNVIVTCMSGVTLILNMAITAVSLKIRPLEN